MSIPPLQMEAPSPNRTSTSRERRQRLHTVFCDPNLGRPRGKTPDRPITAEISAHHDGEVCPRPNKGIGAGELFSVLRAMRAGITYANVHTVTFPGGEIRGQLSFTASAP